MLQSLWQIIGHSLRGKAHFENDTPCQDAHYFEMWTESTGIAVVCDGAGSCEHSHLGSGFVVERTLERTRLLLEEHKWLEKGKAPDAEAWSKSAHELIMALQEDLREFATEQAVEYKSLSCTWILLLYSPHTLLVAHVGDGRAGYADREEKWQSVMTPFKGEQVGQTVFLTSELDTGAEDHLIETRVIADEITAFALMSDGCELACWKCYDKYPDEERYYDPNIPDQSFFEQNVRALKSMSLDGLPAQEIEEKWSAFLENGNEALRKETDDKTMILGTLIVEEDQQKPLDTHGDQTDHE